MAQRRRRANGEGSVYRATKNGKRKWVAELATGKLTRKGWPAKRVAYLETQKQALEKLAAWRREKAEGADANPGQETVASLVVHDLGHAAAIKESTPSCNIIERSTKKETAQGHPGSAPCPTASSAAATWWTALPGDRRSG